MIVRRMPKVVVAVLLTGVFAGVGCGLAAKREAAMKTKSKSNLKQIDQALQMFSAMNSAFPKTLEEMTVDNTLSELAGLQNLDLISDDAVHLPPAHR